MRGEKGGSDAFCFLVFQETEFLTASTFSELVSSLSRLASAAGVPHKQTNKQKVFLLILHLLWRCFLHTGYPLFLFSGCVIGLI